MAIDTKLNLNSYKFEQISGDTLNLSGSTCIFSGLTIANSGTFTILPSAGAGKILTSDAYGKATWQSSVSAASDERITRLICQTSHGFVVNDVIDF